MKSNIMKYLNIVPILLQHQDVLGPRSGHSHAARCIKEYCLRQFVLALILFLFSIPV